MTSYVIADGKAHITWDENEPALSLTASELDEFIAVCFDAARDLEIASSQRSEQVRDDRSVA